jgi:phage/plasmid-like protein (TIGR03299 family)
MSERDEKIIDLLSNHGLAWTANKKPLFAWDKVGDMNDMNVIPTDNYGVFRSDNNECLGVCKERYQVFQNGELAQTIVDAAGDLNLDVKKGGVLQGGRKVFLQIVLPEDTVGNSGIRRYLTAMNSHDGSSSIGFGTTNTVVFCENTYHAAMKDVSKIRHTQSYKERVKEAVEAMQMAISGESQLMDDFKRMADVKIKDDQYVVDLVQKILKVNPNEKASTRKSNQVIQMAKDINTDVQQHGSNLWGLFNGITRYTNHSQVKTEKSLENVMVGSGAKMNDFAFKEIMKQVNASLSTSILV